MRQVILLCYLQILRRFLNTYDAANRRTTRTIPNGTTSTRISPGFPDFGFSGSWCPRILGPKYCEQGDSCGFLSVIHKN